MKTACFTGHRILTLRQKADLQKLLPGVILKAYGQGYRCFVCGGAMGFDTVAAQQVLLQREMHADIRLHLILPCKDQADRWQAADQSAYERILNQADHVSYISEQYYQGCMLERNRRMVDQSDLCICYLHSFRGGTAYTVRYALGRGLDVINLAMNLPSHHANLLKENPCSFIFISPSAKRNADTVHFHLLRVVKLKRKTI